MADLFVPISKRKPKAVDINGHRLLILARSRAVLERDLKQIGADGVRRVEDGASFGGQKKILEKLAKESGGGIVIAEGRVRLERVIKSLESELPWIQ